MRWIGWLVAVCLLAAGAARTPSDRERTRRCYDEIHAVNVLAKVAVRRHDTSRPIRAVGLDLLAPVTASNAPAPPRTYVEIVHASPLVRHIVVETAFDARGPPVG